MLANYDAAAIAEIMGIAFLRSAQERALPAAKLKAAKGTARRPTGDDGVIVVDDATILVVPCKPSRGSPVPPTPVFIEKAVEQGLPRDALRHVAAWLAGGDKGKASIVEWGVVPKTTLERRDARLSPQESERTERIARLSVHASRALGTAAEAREFMTTPHPELDGRSPLKAAKTDLGTRRTEQLLNVLEYGLAV